MCSGRWSCKLYPAAFVLLLLPGLVRCGGGSPDNTSLSATTYYVSPSGSDSNPGTQTLPFLTIGHSTGVVKPGDTVIVENGIYQECPYNGISGTASAPITFEAQNQWGAVVAPTSAQQSGCSGLMWQINASYVTLEGFEVVGPTSGNTYNAGIKIQLENPLLAGDVVSHNEIHEVGAGQCNGGAGILSGGTNAIIDSNLIYDIGAGGGMDCNDWDGIYMDDGNGQTAINNIVFGFANDPGFTALTMNNDAAPGHPYAPNFPSNCSFINNTVINNSGTQDFGVYMSCAPSTATCNNNLINNNILDDVGKNGGNTIFQMMGRGTFGSSNQYLNNLIYNSGSPNINSGQNLVNTVTSNPDFVNYTGDQAGNYELQSSSPAIGAGTSTGCPAHDFNNVQRTGTCTIGAYTYPSTGQGAPAVASGLMVTVQ